ncbi:hypothetical protein BGX34_000006 [Mortierella sp. NVP85]|nr:hypothetical protein BGX34_000006 [Mortierella sp. NVP85]
MIRVGSEVKFFWNDTQTNPIETFKLNIYCYENSKLITTLGEFNATNATSPQYWIVDSSILKTQKDCPLNQYQGGFEWIYYDLASSVYKTGVTRCKVMLLVGPGVASAPGASPPPPSQSDSSELPPTDPDDEPGPRTVIVTDRTKHILIGVGSAVGALFLAGFVGFYFIRYKNKHAEQESIKKRRESQLLPASSASVHGGGNGQVPVRPQSEIVEMEGIPTAPTPVLEPAPASRPQSYVSSPLARPEGMFVADRPPSVLTSSFTPPNDYQKRQSRLEEEQQREQQLQHHQHQHQLQLQQQHHQQQQDLSNGTYPF